MRLLLILPLLIFTSCQTNVHSEGREEYIKAIESHSGGDKQFSGLYHNFEFRTTLLSHEITKTVHQRMEQIYDWSTEESSEKLQAQMDKLENTTRLWLSFFTSERKNDNLATKRSIWKIYLVTPATRYEGKAIKANVNLSEAKELYPYHTRWATPYYIEFPVASAEVENEDLKLVITGPLGRREINLPSSRL